MNRDLDAEQMLEEDARALFELSVEEASIVALWAYLELGRLARWKFLRRRFLERVWRDKCEEVDWGRAALRRAAP